MDLTPQLNFHLLWRPFQLNPNMPIKGMDRQGYLELKFGGKKNAIETYRAIYDQGIEPKVFINDFLELIYYFKNIKSLTLESTNFSLNDEEFSKIKQISK